MSDSSVLLPAMKRSTLSAKLWWTWLSGSGHGFPVLGTGASGGALFRVDVGRFAVLYETSDIVHVVEVYIP